MTIGTSKGTSTLVFDEFGNMEIKEEGFTGNACAERTAKLMKGLAHGAKTEKDTPERFRIAVDRGRIQTR